jgi:TldD protein
MITRRHFLGSSAAVTAFAAELFAAPEASTTPSPALEKLGDVALREAKKLKASYCDIRINRYHDQTLGIRLNPERGSSKTLEAPTVYDSVSFGFGVRVIADGAWGFAASPVVTPEEIARVTGEAVTIARANAALKTAPLQLAPVKAYRDRWTAPFEKNPFDVPLAEKLEILRAAAREIKAGKGVFASGASLDFHCEDKYFASSEGSSIQQLIIQTIPNIRAVAVDRDAGLSKTRNYSPAPLSIGYEYLQQIDLIENGKRIREEVIDHLAAPPVKPGRKDLLLLPSHLWLTIHESIGHSTELDRALGYEANFAGTSFLTPDKLHKQRIGSDIVNIYGDRTTPRALSTVAYDDDGVKTMKFPIIDKGIFAGYQTIRDQAHLIGETESKGCCYAQSWADVPFQRMPNVSLAPGNTSTTVEDLLSGIDDGILIEGNGSFSIDQQRYNFQFGGDAFWEIKGGKKRGMLSRVAYQSKTADFWSACDGIAGPSYFQMYGATNDGKGEPIQVNAVTHGCSPARFRNVNVLVTD